MSSSCPETDPLRPAPNVPVSPERQPGVSVHAGPDGTRVQVDQHITAGEFGLSLALLVASGARLDRELVLHFLPANPLPQ